MADKDSQQTTYSKDYCEQKNLNGLLAGEDDQYVTGIIHKQT